MGEITVIKQNHHGEEVYRWQGMLLERGDSYVLLEARFRLSGLFMGEAPLYVGDRFVESYFSDRWSNIFEIHDRDSDLIKCWYCNVTYPANLGTEIISYRDLVLDLLVYPDGRQVVLDEEEFEAVNISPEDKVMALAALEELKTRFRQRLAK